MRPKEPRPGSGAKELAGWTQASLATVGSSLRSAGTSLFSGLRAGYEHLTADRSDKERILVMKFGKIEVYQQSGAESACEVLLLGYEQGFQVWSLQGSIREIASRRDSAVWCIEPLPLPLERDQEMALTLSDWPLIAVVLDVNAEVNSGLAKPPGSSVQLYSLHRHMYIRSFDVPGQVLAVSSNRRTLLVAMASQIMAYDLATLTVSYSAITYPAPDLRLSSDGGLTTAPMPLALGPRWLAHASNQAVQSASGVALSKPLTNSNCRIPPASSNIEAVHQYASLAARTSSKHIKNFGEAGYKYLSSQLDTWRSPSSAAPASPSSTSMSGSESEVVGTVIVRDMVSRTTLVHFRAHTSPLLLLRFDGSGTLLVTASVHGHTVNIFHIVPGSASGSAGQAKHVFRLSRGITPATILDASFSCGGHWLSVSSARGTTHIFDLSIDGKEESPPHVICSAQPNPRAISEPIKLAPVGRARASGLLNGSIPGSAAASAAINMYSGSLGERQIHFPRAGHWEGLVAAEIERLALAPSDLLPVYKGYVSGTHLVAAAFSHWKVVEPDGLTSAEAALSEGLLICSSDGLLIRYQLSKPHLHAPLKAPSHHQDESKAELLAAVEQWDVGRRRSWPEREEIVGDGNDSSGEEAEESQGQPWASHAETQLPDRNWVPLWMDSQFHILEMQTSGSLSQRGGASARESEQPNLASNTILQVEEVPTRRINHEATSHSAPVIIEGAETAVLRGAQLGAPHSPL